jgi:hypothetical protein
MDSRPLACVASILPRWRTLQEIIGDRFIYYLADSKKNRAESDAAWAKETIAAGEWELIRKSLQRGAVNWQSVLSVAKDLMDEIEKKIERRVEFRRSGRSRRVGN